MRIRQLLGVPVFWLMILLMICAGASEATMSQWASAFTESALGISKTIGDLAGDLGATVSPAMVGKISEMAGGNLKTGLLAVTAFPVILTLGLIFLKINKKVMR